MAKNKKEAAKPTQKAPKKGRPVFDLVGSKDAKVYPFQTSVPDGYDFAAHKSLKKRDFAAEWLYLEFRAKDMDYRAEKFRKQAEASKKLGSVADRAKAKRLVRLQDKMEELKKQLQEQGVDVDSLLKSTDE